MCLEIAETAHHVNRSDNPGLIRGFRAFLFNLGFMIFRPVYWRCGGRFHEWTRDYRYMKTKLPFGRRTRNYVGTHFGGSIYAFMDPIYMFMLIHNLGKDYIVWDLSAEIEFVKAVQSDLYAEFYLSEAELDLIKEECSTRKKTHRPATATAGCNQKALRSWLARTVLRRSSAHSRPARQVAENGELMPRLQMSFLGRTGKARLVA